MLCRAVEVLKLINNFWAVSGCLQEKIVVSFYGNITLKLELREGGLVCFKTPMMLKCLTKSLKD